MDSIGKSLESLNCDNLGVGREFFNWICYVPFQSSFSAILITKHWCSLLIRLTDASRGKGNLWNRLNDCNKNINTYAQSTTTTTNSVHYIANKLQFNSPRHLGKTAYFNAILCTCQTIVFNEICFVMIQLITHFSMTFMSFNDKSNAL